MAGFIDGAFEGSARQDLIKHFCCCCCCCCAHMWLAFILHSLLRVEKQQAIKKNIILLDVMMISSLSSIDCSVVVEREMIGWRNARGQRTVHLKVKTFSHREDTHFVGI